MKSKNRKYITQKNIKRKNTTQKNTTRLIEHENFLNHFSLAMPSRWCSISLIEIAYFGGHSRHC